MQRVIGVAGFKNAGKTTLVEKLVRHLTERGYRVSTVKHAHHSFDIDHEGRDSFRHRKAGATEVAVISRDRTAIIHELRGEEPPTLLAVLARLQSCDLVIVEGYKRDAHDKIEVLDVSLNHPRLAPDDPSVVAVAALGKVTGDSVPVFDRDDVTALVDFIIQHCRLDLPRLELRRAGLGDAADIQRLAREVYAKWVGIIGREPLPMKADYGHAVVNHWIDLWEHDGQVLAYIETVARADHLFIVSIVVAEAWQGQGLARQLIDHAFRLARKSGLPDVKLLTNKAFTSNVQMYLHLGFTLYAEEPFAGGITVHFRKSVS